MSDQSRAESIFFAALDITDPAERDAHVAEACSDDDALRQQVQELLAAHARLGDFLQTRDESAPAGLSPEINPPATGDDPGETLGTIIAGRYKLLQQIGEGGMGVVYMAEQIAPVRRMVALKIIKPGMDSAQVVARFEAERQALALMDHPNIAKVLDGGTTGGEPTHAEGEPARPEGEPGPVRAGRTPAVPSPPGAHAIGLAVRAGGRPFFVMELVKGVPITKFCDENRLTPHERLELFVAVCQAVQHAHQKGIIHRDLKPTNVLVALYDGKPVPKVIDFGVAKALHQKLTERTLFTAFGAMVGTLEYMSPEQAELNALDVDTRSDVYSLGVLLYELLTGTTPLQRERLRKAAYTEVLRLIREEEPPRPSNRLSSSGAALARISAQRKTEPAQLARLLRGELDWIVMKALEKDRGRRYEASSALARDVERYLKDEPVEACPPSLGYRLRKFARKNRAALATAAAFGALLVAAAAISIELMFQARRAEADALIQRDQAGVAKQQANEERNRANQEANQAKRNAQEAERRAAIGQLLSAQAAWRDAKADLARQYLNQVPTEHRGWVWRYLKRQYLGGLFVLQGHTGCVTDCAYSSDQRFIATSGHDKTVRLWDGRTGQPISTLVGHTGAVNSLAFEPGGCTLFSGGADKTVRVWDVQSRSAVTVFSGHGASISRLALSPDGGLLAAATDDGSVWFWDVHAGKKLKVLQADLERLLGIAWAPGGEVFATTGWDGSIRIWDPKTGLQIRSTESRDLSATAPLGLCFSPDSKVLISANYMNEASLWDWRTEAPPRKLSPSRESALGVSYRPMGRRVAVSPDGSFLATTGTNSRCLLWDINSGLVLKEFLGHGEEVLSVAFSPDGSRLLTCSGDSTARVWDLREMDTVRQLPTLAKDFCFPTLTAAGTKILRFNQHAVIVDDLSNERIVRSLPIPGREFTAAAINADGGKVVTAGTLLTPIVWDAKTAREIIRLDAVQMPVARLEFSAMGSRIVGLETAGNWRVWDATSGTMLSTWKSREGCRSIALSPDDKAAAFGFDDGMVEIRQLTTGRIISSIPRYSGAIACLAFSPGGDKLMIASGGLTGSRAYIGDGTDRIPFNAAIRDVRTGAVVSRLQALDWHLTRAMFSTDGNELIAGDADGRVYIWSTGTGALLCPLEPKLSWRTSGIDFTTDGSLIALSWTEVAAWKAHADPTNLDPSISPGPEELAKRVSLATTDSAWHIARMDALSQAHLWQGAAFHGDWALRTQPWSADLLVRLGHLELLRGRPHPALQCFLRACFIDPNCPLYPKDWSQIFQSLGEEEAEKMNWKGSIRRFREALACDPSSNREWFSIWHQLGTAYLASNDTDGATMACREGLEWAAKVSTGTSDHDVEAILEICIARSLSAEHAEKALGLATRLDSEARSREPPLGPSARRTGCLGACLYRAGKLSDARTQLLKAVSIKKEDNDAMVRLFLAMTESRLGDGKAARKCLAEADQLRDGVEKKFWDFWLRKYWWNAVRKEAGDLIGQKN